jgi:hypothetical protein
MAQKIRLTLIDDIDGSEADETVSFVFDGISYEIDLSSRNAEQFRRDLTPYIEHARQLKRPGPQRRITPTRAGRGRSSEIREWARQRGHKVSERGQIPGSIIKQYEMHGSQPVAAGPSPGPDFDEDE